MVEKLSESGKFVSARLDAGHGSLPWEHPRLRGILAGLDFDKILSQSNAAAIIHSIPVQPLYYSLKQRGFGECLEVLKRLSEDQMIRITDFEVWSRGELVPAKAYEYLNYFGKISPEVMFLRFQQLDEELQIALLNGRVQIYEASDLDDLPDPIKDQLIALPGEQIFYRIKDESEAFGNFITGLMDGALKQSIPYAISLLNYGTFSVAGDGDLLMKQFRDARMQEEGFVPYEESCEVFYPIDMEQLASRLPQVPQPLVEGLVIDRGDGCFLDQVVEQATSYEWSGGDRIEFEQRMVFLANSICSAVSVEPDDIKSMGKILTQAKSLVSLGLEILVSGDVDLASKVLLDIHPKDLFRSALTAVRAARIGFCRQLSKVDKSLGDRLHKLQGLHRYGQAVTLIDTELRDLLGFEASEILKGLFNRFPMCVELDEATSGRGSFRFSPVGSVLRLKSLIHWTDGIIATMLAADQMPMEWGITRGLALRILGREHGQITIEACNQLATMDSLAFKAALSDCCEEWVTSFSKSFTDWSCAPELAEQACSLEAMSFFLGEIAAGLESAQALSSRALEGLLVGEG